MRTKTRNKPQKQRVRAFKNKYKQLRKKSMAFFNRGRRFGRRNFSRGFKPRFNNFRPRFSRPRFRRGGNRIPYVGRFIPRALQPLLILAAIVGGVWYFFKDQLKPLIEKLKNHSS